MTSLVLPPEVSVEWVSTSAQAMHALEWLATQAVRHCARALARPPAHTHKQHACSLACSLASQSHDGAAQEVGLDCEWTPLPDPVTGEAMTRVAVLQLGTMDRVVLLDTLAMADWAEPEAHGRLAAVVAAFSAVHACFLARSMHAGAP